MFNINADPWVVSLAFTNETPSALCFLGSSGRRGGGFDWHSHQSTYYQNENRNTGLKTVCFAVYFLDPAFCGLLFLLVGCICFPDARICDGDDQ